MAAAHEVLGVSPDASVDEIEAAYRRLAQIYHPDRYATGRPEVQAEAAQRMRSLNDAREEMRRTARQRPVDDSEPPPPPPPAPRSDQPAGAEAAAAPRERQAGRRGRGCLVAAAVAAGMLTPIVFLIGFIGDSLLLILTALVLAATALVLVLVSRTD